jgi:hypothetical protein
MDIDTDLEAQLFSFDAGATTRRADEFVRSGVRAMTSGRARAIRIPELPGGYLHVGGESTIVRANEVALTLATRRAAA